MMNLFVLIKQRNKECNFFNVGARMAETLKACTSAQTINKKNKQRNGIWKFSVHHPLSMVCHFMNPIIGACKYRVRIWDRRGNGRGGKIKNDYLMTINGWFKYSGLVLYSKIFK
jgi:hypothetical protein